MKLYKYLTLLILSLFIFSCSGPEGGLFYSLEQESAIENGTLPDDITIGSMDRSNNYYFIAAGKFLYKPVSPDADWPEEDVNLNPAGYADSLCYDLLIVGNTIYASFFDIDTTNYSLLTADASTVKTGLKWSSGAVKFSDTDIAATENIIGFEKVEDVVFLHTSSTSNSFNIYAAAYSTFTLDSNFIEIASGISAGGELRVDYNDLTAVYWVAAGNKVYTTDGATAGTDVTADIMATSSSLKGSGFGGVACIDDDVYITSEEGVMLNYNTTDNWSVIPSQYDTTNGLFESLKDIIHVQISNADESLDILLAGSANGYYEMDMSLAEDARIFVSPEYVDTKLTTYNQYSSIELSEQIINSFYLDSTSGEEQIFALGYNAGLWANSLKKDSTPFYRFWDVE